MISNSSHKLLRCIFCFSLCIGYLSAYSQQTIRYERFSTFDGLGNNSIYDITTDSKGYIWFATYDGLTRYDGYEFIKFKSDQNNSVFVGSNIIKVLAPDSLDQIWFGASDTGLSVYKPETGYFRNYNFKGEKGKRISGNDVAAITHLGNKVWIGTTKGLDILNTKSDSIQAFSLTQFGVSNHITSLVDGPDDYVWVGTSNGVVLVKIQNNQILLHPSFLVNYTIKNEHIRFVYKDHKGLIWLICSDHIQAVSFNEKKGISLKYKFSLDQFEISGKENTSFSSIAHDFSNRYWLATNNGLLVFKIDDSNELTVRWSHHDLYNNESLSGNYIRSLCCDREGLMWIGTRFNGVNLYNPYKQPFKRYMRRMSENSTMYNNNVRTIIEDQDENIWIGYWNSGLDYLDTKTNIYKHFEEGDGNQDNIPSKVIRGMFQDKEGRMWLGTNFGFTEIIKKDEDFTFRNYSSLNGNKLGGGYEFFIDSKDRFWIGTTNGLVQFHKESETGQIYSHSSNEYLNNQRNFIRCIAEDKEGNLWLATDGGGLDKFNPETGSFTGYKSELTRKGSISHNKIYCLLFDSKNRLWVGTHNGLNLMNKNGKQVQLYSESDGLINNVVYSIQEDQKGDLWISTSNGLSCLTPDTGKFRNYLQGFEFSDDAWWKNSKGEIFVGGVNGFFKFDPNSLLENEIEPKVYLTGFSLQNKIIKSGDIVNGRVLLASSISDTRKIDLFHNETFFTIDLLALSFSNPDYIQYSYKLEGFNSDWIHLDSKMRSATYTNVPNGEYQFKYKAANADGVWSQESDLTIVIHPAFYQTTWFKIALVLLLILMILFLYKLRLRSLTQQKQRLETEVEQKTKDLRQKKEAIEKQNSKLECQNKEIEEQQEKLVKMTQEIHEADERKMRFFTSISHEIRTPLTLISGPIEHLIDTIPAEDKRFGGLQLVQRNTNRLLNLVNQLLDFRKIDSGHMPVNKVHGDLKAFVNELFLRFEGMAIRKSIRYQFLVEDANIETCFDADVLEKIITNLLSNALKYTPNEGEVSLHLERNLNEIILSVKDNGPGISLDQKDDIFKRFFRDSNKCIDTTIGTGIGLAFAKELSILHGGDINVTTGIGKGSCFQLRFPVADQNQEVLYKEDDVKIESQSYDLMNSSIEDFTVLIIEDNADLRSFIKDSLGVKNVIEAENGDEGIKLAIENLPDIILSDILMPGKNGFEVCRLLKQDERTNHIPIILLTALGAEENQQAGINLGADDYIVKPFNHRILSGKVHNIVLARKRFKENLQRNLVSSQEQNDGDWKHGLPPFIFKIIELIEIHMHQPNFGVEELGRLMRISRSTLYRKMKSVTDKSAVEFIREVRIRKAMELLVNEPDIQIAELSYKVGFVDTDYFRQCFKKQFGKTPKEILASSEL
ncbi:MAG: hypothetical protein COC06_01470 [Bacteroidales bacterium]|nr:MAG: hypothetical protein COC06_01470 [Bacteroidales bacterium]